MGRLLDHLERAGQLDSTLVILASDNGASPEGGPEGMWNEIRLFSTNSFDRWPEGFAHFNDLGAELSYPTYPTGWTMAGSTPFRSHKGTAYMGGTRVPLILSWPAKIREAGGVRTQFHNVIDLLPTALEAAGVDAPAVFEGRTQQRIDGTSMAYTWTDAAAPSRRATQYVESYGHRAIYHEGWKAVAFHPPGTPFGEDRWELFDLARDFNETRDLAAGRPYKLAEMLAVWEREARANEVDPLDDRKAEREVLLPPDAPQRGTHFEFFPPVSGLHKAAAPDLRKRSWKLTAEVGANCIGSNGALAAFGGRFAGWSLYLKDGTPVFHYNHGAVERTTITADRPLGGPAVHEVGVTFTAKAAGSAEVVLTIDGREAARGQVPRVLSIVSHESLDFGCDLYTPVTEDYVSPAALPPGVLQRVTIDAEPYEP